MELKTIEELLQYDRDKLEEVMLVHDQKAKLKDSILYEEKDLEDKLWNNAHSLIDSKKEEIRQKELNFKTTNNQLFEEKSKQIDQLFHEKKETWLNELFNNCIK